MRRCSFLSVSDKKGPVHGRRTYLQPIQNTERSYPLRMIRSLALAVCGAALALGTIPAHATTTTENYTAGPIGDGVNECRQDNRANVNVSAACYSLAGGTHVVATVIDDINPNVDFYWEFDDASG